MKAILIDDESLALEFLENQLEKLNAINILGKFTHFSTEEHTDLLKKINIVFLDIEMPEVNGLELAAEILKVNADIEIIFITAFNEYAVEAFELNALDYLLKPVTIERLQNTYERLKQRVNQQKQLHEEVQDKQLTIQLGEELAFIMNGEPYPVSWRTAKTKELFLYLLHNRGSTIRKEFLADYFWSTLDPEKANAQMYTTIYHIRRTLKPIKEHIWIESNQEGYRLELENVILDLYEWENNLQALPTLNEKTASTYQKVLEAYPGTYLGTTDYLWDEAERYRLQELWLKHAYELASFYCKNHTLEKAKHWYTTIVHSFEDETSAHFELMKIYANEDQETIVKQHYEKIVEIHEDLNFTVSEEIKEWYKKWYML